MFRSRAWHLALVTILAIAAPVAGMPPKINGEIEEVGPYRLLRVWGNYQEMGFAHGYLLADDVLDVLAERYAAIPRKQRAAVDKAQRALVGAIHVPADSMAEIQGIFDGLRVANDGVPRIKAFKRKLMIEDLILLNASDTLRAFGCSGFTAWGDKAGEFGVVTGRNFDYPVPGRKSLASQMILVRSPTGRRQVATITWPGYLGAVTGVNEAGVCTFVHDGTGGRTRTPASRYVPLGLALKSLLESVGAAGAFTRAEADLRAITPYPFSYMIRVVTPRVGDKTAAPVRVFRIDPSGYGENATDGSLCITTNHYIEPGMKPDAGANDWSLRRYEKIGKRLDSAVTKASAWKAMRDVMSPSDDYPTLHTVVVYPERRRLEFSFAAWNKKKLIPAPKRRAVAINFDRLFKARP